MKLSRILLAVAALGSTSALAATYTVKSGDTLYSVAKANGLTPQALMSLNNLSSSTIQLGQALNVGGGAGTSPAPVAAAQPQPTAQTATVTPASSGGAFVRVAAARFLGIRYAHGGLGGGGLDCSGFTMRVFQQMGISLPRTAAAQWGRGVAVSRRDLQAGDLVFFNTTGRVASHVGIYLGNGMMANANSFYGKTMIEPLFSNSYWSTRYVGARRVLN